jgi:probable rRNA maturation factor
MARVNFNYLKQIALKDRGRLKSFILSIFKKEGKKPGTINFIFCDDPQILQVNRDYLQHNYFTDIITFDLSEPGSNSIDADIYISIDTVRDNAKHYKVSIKTELHRVVFHGILHLCGFNDKSPHQQKRMREKENFYLNRYFPDFHE